VLRNVAVEDGVIGLGRRLGLVPLVGDSTPLSVPVAPAPATFRELSREYLESLAGDEGALAAAEEAMVQHFLPRFGHRAADGLGWKEVSSFIASLDLGNSPGLRDEDVKHLRKQAARMWSLAVDMELVGADEAPEGSERVFGRRSQVYAPVSVEEGRELLNASRSSPNRQLKFIMALLMLTGARTSEILNMRWSDIDLAEATWHITLPNGSGRRQHSLNAAALKLVNELPRLGDCPYVLPNLATRKPYQTLTRSWEVVKQRANVPHLELDDLRDCDFGEREWEDALAPILV
jgi:integrase